MVLAVAAGRLTESVTGVRTLRSWSAVEVDGSGRGAGGLVPRGERARFRRARRTLRRLPDPGRWSAWPERDPAEQR